VAFLLLFEALFQGGHQLVPAHLLDGGLLFRAQFELQGLAQPFQRQVLGEVGQQFDALEVGAEGAVELVEVRLVLDQRRTRQEIEVIDRRADDLGLEGFEQSQVFLDGYRQLGSTKRVKEVNQHGAASDNVLWAL
jgi:hypothetical protein